METQKDIQEYIDRYRLGEISESDFKNRISKDPALRREFELHQKDIQAIRAGAKAELRRKSVEALNKHEKRSRSIVPMQLSLKIAAAFVFLVAAFFLFRHNNQSMSSIELYATYFELPPPSAERNGSEHNELWNESMTAYSKGEFEKAIELLTPVVGDSNYAYPDRGKLYLGLSLLMSDKSQEAIRHFENISSESSYYQEAEWYRALTFLQMGKVEESREAFQRMVDQPRHFKNKEAEEILKDL